jgi:hypothetical protein
LPRGKTELFPACNILGEVVEVEGFAWNEIVTVDGRLIELGERFDSSDFLRKVVVIEEIKILIGF